MKKLARTVTVLFLVICLFSSALPVQAGINWGKSVPITKANQVVNAITVNGKTVNAVYAPRSSIANYDSNATYCCAAYVKRFYSQIYGINVSNLLYQATPVASRGSFSKTTSPRAGDIATCSFNEGGYKFNHWAIVKRVSGSSVTLCEQNAWYDKNRTAAAVDRVITPGSGYYYFRWSEATNLSTNEEKKQTAAASFSLRNLSATPSGTNATIKCAVSNPTRVRVTQVGCKIYTSNGKLVKTKTESCSRAESTFYVSYNLNKELGMTLSYSTAYKYQFFLTYGGKTYSSSTSNFKTNAKPQPKFTLNIQSPQTYTNNAVVKASVSNPSRVKVTQVGIRIYNASGRLIKTKTETCSRGESLFYVHYNIKNELSLNLARKTAYKYQIFIKYAGNEFATPVSTFKTK